MVDSVVKWPDHIIWNTSPEPNLNESSTGTDSMIIYKDKEDRYTIYTKPTRDTING